MRNFFRQTSLMLLVFSGMFMACEEEYNKDALIDGFKRHIVVNSYFSSSTPWSVSVSVSGNRIDKNTNIEYLEDATVEIYNGKGEFLYELFHTEGGEYSREGYTPSAGQKYTIRVEAKNFPDVVAHSYVPAKSKLIINEFTELLEDSKEGVEVDFKIKDDSDLKSYYLWEVVALDEENKGEIEENLQTDFSKGFLGDLENDKNDLGNEGVDIIGGQVFQNGSYNTKYNTFENGRSGSGRGGSSTKPTSDDLANMIITPNKVLPPTTSLEDLLHGINSLEESETNAPAQYKFELRVLSISKELYDYYNSVDEYRKTGEYGSSVHTPFKFYTNVHNGLGVFAGFNESYIRF